MKSAAAFGTNGHQCMISTDGETQCRISFRLMAKLDARIEPLGQYPMHEAASEVAEQEARQFADHVVRCLRETVKAVGLADCWKLVVVPDAIEIYYRARRGELLFAEVDQFSDGMEMAAALKGALHLTGELGSIGLFEEAASEYNPHMDPRVLEALITTT